jgi:uncharacterized Ntn-hydrolase superfamily protein
MTWSIVARDVATGRVGIIVATRFFAVGSLVPYILTGVGAVATQAFVNPRFGPDGLALLAAGGTPPETVQQLLATDEGRDHRQVHLMDSNGVSAAYTGRACVEWAGHLLRENYSIAGNMLAGPQVIEATAEAYERNSDRPFARRLIAAMMAGEAEGGDKRGKQSAALLIHDSEEYPLYDLRVDDHADPLPELARLQTIARQRFLHFRRRMPTRDAPSGDTDRSTMEDFIARSIAEGYE